MNQYKYISKKDAVGLIEITNDGLSCDNKTKFLNLFDKLKMLISFDYASCTYTDLNPDFERTKSPIHFLDINFPTGFLNRYYKKKYYNIDLQLKAFLMNFEIKNYRDAIVHYNGGTPNILDLEGYEVRLTDGWIYGSRDIDLTQLAIINLCGANIENNKRTETIVKIAISHLCEIYKKVFKLEKRFTSYLTKREMEVLNWLKEGKTSWEISKILHISERVTNFHVNNLKKKLNAVNRTQAVAIAIGKRLIAV